MSELFVEILQTSSLGDRSYLAHDGRVAVVVDPQRDIDRVLALAGRLGVRVTHVVETHLHNDYVSGGLALARVTGASYLVNAADAVDFERVPVTDGLLVDVSPLMSLRVVATPGHTFHHLSYLLLGSDEPVGVFTGGSLLFGTTGRTDLLGSSHAASLAEHQHHSVRRLADLLPDGAHVWPTHGFGSFCSAGQTDATSSTIGRERTANPALRLEAPDFVASTLAGLDRYPAYYAHMGARNSAGADLIDLSPVRPADAAELATRIGAGEWVVDLRTRKAFAERHLAGTLSFGLDGALATWLGWMAPWGAPITLLGESAEQVAEAQRELARIGIDRPAAAALPDFSGPSASAFASLRTATWAGFAAVIEESDVILDIRLPNEWRVGHVAEAIHVPLPDLPSALGTLPPGTIWVHCASGYRAAAAASYLQRAGRSVVHIDDAFPHAAANGFAVVTSP
ncbi:MBL fold metallo-hydrolase [Actinoplanes sp. NPDC051851]|uniref:MBL fold metallo-hydrolase n=1 Tax=Actinoplanes sp. NPDC051851 TaxID=3154753 RepID=UPI003448F6F8